MSKKRTGRATPASGKKQKQRSSNSRSLTIPIVVGLVVAMVAVGAIISFRDQGTTVGGDATGPLATAQARATRSIPYPDIMRISLEETLQKLEQDEAVLIDVRSSSAYEKAHAAGASSFPEDEIEARLAELAQDKDLVLY